MLVRECLCMFLHSELERVCWHVLRSATFHGDGRCASALPSFPHWPPQHRTNACFDESITILIFRLECETKTIERWIFQKKKIEHKTILKIACSDSVRFRVSIHNTHNCMRKHLRTRTSKNVPIWKLFSKTERDETPMGTWGLFGTCFTTSPNSSCWTVFLTGITLHFAVLCFCFREPRRHPAEWRLLDLPDPGTSTTYKWLDEKAAWPLCHRSIKFIQDARNVNQLQKNRISRQRVIYLQRPQQLIWIFSPKQGHGQNSRLRITTCISLKKTKRILR